jgi:hypothetical protein
VCRSGEEGSQQVPKELWFLCDMMTSLGLGQEQLFLSPGSRHSANLFTPPPPPPPPPSDADPGFASKNLSILTKKNCFSQFGNMNRVVHLGSGSWFFYPSRIQGSKKHRIPDPEPQHCHHQLNIVLRTQNCWACPAE